MKAEALVLGLVLMVAVPVQAQHGGGGHSGSFGGGHFGGGHFGGHSGRGHGRSGHWGSAHGWGGRASFGHLGPQRITTFVGFSSAPGFRPFLISNGFFCPSVPHRVSPFCHICGLGFFGSGFFGFPFGFDDFGTFTDVSYQPIPLIPLAAGTTPPSHAVLVFRNGWTFGVTDYWIDDEGELRYVTTYGGMNIVDLQSLDLYATAKANAERGIPFVLKVRPAQ